jgi:hypothetical protein
MPKIALILLYFLVLDYTDLCAVDCLKSRQKIAASLHNLVALTQLSLFPKYQPIAKDETQEMDTDSNYLTDVMLRVKKDGIYYKLLALGPAFSSHKSIFEQIKKIFKVVEQLHFGEIQIQTGEVNATVLKANNVAG